MPVDSTTGTRYVNIAGSYSVIAKEIRDNGIIGITTGRLTISQQEALITINILLSDGTALTYGGSVLRNRVIAFTKMPFGGFTQLLIMDVLPNGNMTGQFTMEEDDGFNTGVFMLTKQPDPVPLSND